MGRDIRHSKVTINHYGASAAKSPANARLTWPRLVRGATPYLRRMLREWRQLPLASLMGDRDDAREQEDQMGLDSVYVKVATDQRRPATAGEKRTMQASGGLTRFEGREGGDVTVPKTALEVLRDERVCVVLGDPGAGKSALLHYLAWNLATLALTREPLKAPGLADWKPDQARAIPVVWVLRRFVKWVQGTLPAAPAGSGGRLPEPGVEHLWKYLQERELKEDEKPGLELLRRAAEQGWVTFLLDGIDEVPDDDLAQFVRDCATDLRSKYPLARVVGTCRTVPYQERRGTRRWPGVVAATLQPFDEERIQEFVGGWFRAEQERCAMPAEQATTKASKLLGAIRDPHRAELRELASNPMLLTVMAFLQAGTEELPENRVTLYQQVTELLLHRWDARRIDDGRMTPTVTELIRRGGMDRGDLHRVLWRIGWLAQCGARHGGRDGLGDVPRSVLHQEIVAARSAMRPDYGWANDLVEAISARAGLLVPVDEDLFQFPHRSFQEYFAAHHLLDRSKPEPRPRSKADQPPTPQEWFDAQVYDYPEGVAVLFDDSMYWREVLRWTVGILSHEQNNARGGLEIMEAFCPPNVLELEHGWLRVWVAGEALHELRLEKARAFPSKAGAVQRVRTLLARIVDEVPASLDVRRRHLAGVALGQVGDPRRGVAPPWPPTEADPFIRWSERVEACPAFQMGGDPHAWGSPEEAVPWPIQHPFHVSAYPVTNAQYDTFEASEEFRVAGWSRRSRSKPRFLVPNHPVVDVTWRDALRFCQWVDGLFQEGSLTAGQLGLPADCSPNAWRILLPTEGQWELAARGTEGRWVPWVPRLPEEPQAPRIAPADLAGRGNWGGEKLEGTSAVGLFPAARSPAGAFDMIGNVWEWTRSLGDLFGAMAEFQEDLEPVPAESGKPRVLRGGSWVLRVPEFLRCATRNDSPPRNSYHDLGFRVVCVRVLASVG